MLHCRQCRSDAVGLLGEDRTLAFFSKDEESSRIFPEIAVSPENNTNRVPSSESSSNNSLPEAYPSTIKVAVASKNEGLIDTHFGHAEEFKIYHVEENGRSFFLEKRPLRKAYCYGQEECLEGMDYVGEIIELLSDCRALFCVRIGWEPERRLKEAGIEVVTTYDRIEDAVHRFLLERQLSLGNTG